MIHHLTIPNWRPAALNEYIGSHWSVGAKLKKRDRTLILGHSREQKIPTAITKRRVSLHITRTGRMRECDPDAFTKSAHDALVYAMLLIDDTSEFVEIGAVTQVKGANLETVITLEDM